MIPSSYGLYLKSVVLLSHTVSMIHDTVGLMVTGLQAFSLDLSGAYTYHDLDHFATIFATLPSLHYCLSQSGSEMSVIASLPPKHHIRGSCIGLTRSQTISGKENNSSSR